MRLIDADALEAILNNWEEKEADRTENDGSDGTTRIVHPVETDTDEMINLIPMQPTIIPTIPHSQWIPVTDRLPENEGDFLVTANDSIIGLFVVKDHCYKGNDGKMRFLNQIDGRQYYNGGELKLHTRVVTAWMPLPEPYQYAEVETNEAD